MSQNLHLLQASWRGRHVRQGPVPAHILRGSVTRSSPCEHRPSSPKKHPTSARVGPAKTGIVVPTCSFLRIGPLKWGHLKDKLPFAVMNDQYEFVGKIPRNTQPPPLTANGRVFHLSLISITFSANTRFRCQIKGPYPETRLFQVPTGSLAAWHPIPFLFPPILTDIILAQSDVCSKSYLL